MPNVLFAQQPILNLQQEVVAYELLFRGDFQRTGGHEASAQVLVNAFDKGLFKGDTHGTPMFINFTEELLFQVPPFDPNSIVIELLEDIEPTAAVVAQGKALRELGYRLALDDFVYSEAMIPLLKLAQIVKVDVMDTPKDELPALVERLRPYGVLLLAEKVEDYDTFYHCRSLGFEWFQGYFFARPNLIEGRTVGPNRSALLSMVCALQQPDLDHATLNSIITSDPGLTYKVLRLANSAAIRRAVPIDTIARATIMLGLRRLQNFGTLLALGQLEEKPGELQIYTQHRGLLCEGLGSQISEPLDPALFQSAGILSCCDAYFDQPLENLLDSLPLSADLSSAIRTFEGPLGIILEATIALQEGRFDSVRWDRLASLGLDQSHVATVMQATTSWLESTTEVELW